MLLSYSKLLRNVDYAAFPGGRESSSASFAVEIPEHWSDMKQKNVCVVELQPSQAEYSTVASKFNQTCSDFNIEKVSLC